MLSRSYKCNVTGSKHEPFTITTDYHCGPITEGSKILLPQALFLVTAVLHDTTELLGNLTLTVDG